MTLVPIDENKETLEKYKELWNKIRDRIRSTTNNLANYDKKYMKIKLNSDDDSLLKERLEHCKMIIVIRSVFQLKTRPYFLYFRDQL